MQNITKREVFYIAGYDPRGYRYYYSLYKKNAKKYNKTTNLNIQISKVKKVNENIHSCKITTDKNTRTTYNFFSWNDIVKETWAEGFLKNFLDTLYFIKMYLFSGICFRFAREAQAQLIAGLYPLFYLLFGISITLFMSITSYKILLYYLSFPFALCTSFLLFFLGLKIVEKIANSIAVFWLSRIYAFCARMSEHKINKIDERIEYFSTYIVEQIKISKNTNKEFIISSHSVGTILAINISNRVIQKCIVNNIDYSNFKLLTLGECIPLVSYQKQSLEYKNILENLGKTKDFTWIDFTATIDGACFCVDPILSSGLEREKNCGPTLLSTRFFKLYKKETYRKIKNQKYKAHFLYLVASDLVGNYDYFDITAGTKPLEFRILNYMKEK